jgi:hypothetical protein
MYPNVMEELTPKCQQLIESGSPKDAKQAIRCLFHNIPDGTETNKSKEGVFTILIEVCLHNLKRKILSKKNINFSL